MKTLYSLMKKISFASRLVCNILFCNYKCQVIQVICLLGTLLPGYVYIYESLLHHFSMYIKSSPTKLFNTNLMSCHYTGYKVLQRGSVRFTDIRGVTMKATLNLETALASCLRNIHVCQNHPLKLNAF